MVGKTLGHYEILEPLGAGGMGEVYRARDATLKREVAVKVLAAEFVDDPDRLARLEREAHLLASLNHPNIATIHSLEHEGDTRFLVLELVKGQSLEQRLAAGPLTVEKAVDFGKQIAEALEAAHGEGIIHRDLKPANVVITPDGRAKVLDFGIAKSVDVGATNVGTKATDLTVAGTLVGTVPFMSPEQIRGEAVDKRADVWAFGCVLFEMLTGGSPFGRETVADTLAAIIEQEPDWRRLPAGAPDPVRSLLVRCLQKDAKLRLRDLGDAWLEMNALTTDPSGALTDSIPAPETVPAGAPIPERRFAAPWIAAALVVGAAVGVLGTWFTTGEPDPLPVLRFSIEPSPGIELNNAGRAVAISPDGTRIVFGADGQLWMRSLEDLEAKPIPGTEAGRTPFFSPDGRQIGFYGGTPRGFKRIDVDGESATSIVDGGGPLGATWGEDGMIYYGRGGQGIWQVPAGGGTARVVVEVASGEYAHGPQLLPGGEWLLYTLSTSQGEWADARIVMQSLVSDDRKILVERGIEGRWVPTGHVVYVRDGTLYAVPFDAETMDVLPGATGLIEGVETSPGVRRGAANYHFSSGGGLVYIASGSSGSDRRLVWVDRQGRSTPFSDQVRAFHRLSLAPDDQRVVVSIEDDEGSNVWVLDGTNGVLSPVTHEGAGNPLWSPGGDWLAFRSAQNGMWGIYRAYPDRLGLEPDLLWSGEAEVGNTDISSDERFLVYHELTASGDWDIKALPLSEQQPVPIDVVSTPAFELAPVISPDDKWLAYVSSQSGGSEVWVTEFPGPGLREQVSTNGGRSPVWAPSGKELFYISGGAVMVIDIETEPALSHSAPRQLFPLGDLLYGGGTTLLYDISSDGQRFMMVEQMGESGPRRIHVVLNWFEELKERVPTVGR